MPDYHVISNNIIGRTWPLKYLILTQVLIRNYNRAEIILCGNMIIYIIATVINNYERANDFLEIQYFLLPFYRMGTPSYFLSPH
jgi:hypothetical protein